MTGFLTIEDINGTVYRNQGFYWHEIDTSKISSAEDFTDVKYDFCEVSRETLSGVSSLKYKYTFKIFTDNWNYGFYVIEENNDIYYRQRSTTQIQFRTDSAYCSLFFYMGNIKLSTVDVMDYILLDKEFNLNLKELINPQTFHIKRVSTGVVSEYSENLVAGYNLIENHGMPGFEGYLLVNLLKTDFQFQCNQAVTVGKVNKVYLGTDSDYLPNGDLVGTYTPTITVTYNGETLPVTYDGTDYYFNLDLTDKTETGKVRFTVNVEANEVLNSTSTDVALDSQYQTVNTFDALLSVLSVSDVIRLGANLTATANIPINRSVKIIGNDKTIDLDSHRFVLVEDVQLTIENTLLNNGDTTIIQAKNTIVNLTGVIFNNCTSTNYNGLGSCIFCDVDVDSLDNTEDYATTLTECTFTNNANCILHGGQLTIKGCTLDNNSITNINTNNPTFIYQTDGTCLIQQSAFDIDYDYSSTEANIGYAQALIMCGETANINGATHTDLQGDNTLPFFDAPFNNRANLHAKYYYPQIEDNVESITLINNKGCCYAVSGVDWVFKNNVTVRRVE